MKGINLMKTLILILSFFLVSCNNSNNPVNPTNNNSNKIYLIDSMKVDSNGINTNIYVKADKSIREDSTYIWNINFGNLKDTTLYIYYIIDTIPINWKLCGGTYNSDTTNRYDEIFCYKTFGHELNYPFLKIVDSIGIKYLQ